MESMEKDQQTIIVRRHWNDYRQAKIMLSSISDLHWADTSGGVGTKSPHKMVYGYVYCDKIIEGELAHSCSHGPGPHRIKVVVVAKDNPAKLMKKLKDDCTKRADSLKQ